MPLSEDVVYLCACAALQGEESRGEGPVDLENDRHPGPDVNVVPGRSLHQRGPGLTQDQKNTCVDYHNKLRKQEGASNMETLVIHATFHVVFRVHLH